jgi:hypothetical protein
VFENETVLSNRQYSIRTTSLVLMLFACVVVFKEQQWVPLLQCRHLVSYASIGAGSLSSMFLV